MSGKLNLTLLLEHKELVEYRGLVVVLVSLLVSRVLWLLLLVVVIFRLLFVEEDRFKAEGRLTNP